MLRLNLKVIFKMFKSRHADIFRLLLMENNSNKSDYHKGARDGRNNKSKDAFRKRGNTKKAAWLEHKLNRESKTTNSAGVLERHKGSYDLEVLKRSPEYLSQVEYLNALYSTSKETASSNVANFDLLLPRSKRKVAVCFGYLGSNYQGLQVNPDAETIEKELERAFFLCGAIQESNFGFLQKVQWTRSARTDRGVHAAAQCCAMKLFLPLHKREQFVSVVNSFLPADIRVHGLTKVSKGFNAKLFCSKRRYHYLLPSYMLMDHKIVNEKLLAAFKEQGAIAGAGYEGGYIEDSSMKCLNAESLRKVRSAILAYRLSPGTLQTLRETLKQFEGTHSFHNFTSNKTANDANASRFIISFTCGEPFLTESDSEGPKEWVLLSVVGQSFLLNQIRKMVCLATEVVRRATIAGAVNEAFKKDKMDIPMAPGLGLYLSELFFDGYNNKQRRESEKSQKIASKAEPKPSPAISSDPSTVINRKRKLESLEGNADSSTLAPADESLTSAAEGNEEPQASNLIAEEAVDTEGDNEQTGGLEPEVDDEGEIDAKHNEDDEGEGEGGAKVMFEEINWHANDGFKTKIDAFVDEVIHPHILAEESSGLHYMYFLDYLRAYPAKYV